MMDAIAWMPLHDRGQQLESERHRADDGRDGPRPIGMVDQHAHTGAWDIAVWCHRGGGVHDLITHGRQLQRMHRLRDGRRIQPRRTDPLKRVRRTAPDAEIRGLEETKPRIPDGAVEGGHGG
jgi:hypothetical protein